MPSEQKLVLANAAGANPDVVIAAPSGLAFTFASRNALKNLLDYDGFLTFYNSEYILESLVSTSYCDGVYGAVDSKNFKLLFYRKDILSSLNLTVPDTWDDVRRMIPTLLRNQMNFYIPISSSASLKGLDTTSPFIFQNGGEIYSTDGITTDINSPESINAITEMTEFYRIYGMQTTVSSFYNSFRYGEVPIGIGDFNIAKNTDRTVHDVAADGTIMVSKIAGNNGNVSINAQQTSNLHAWLQGLFNYVWSADTSQWAQLSLTITAPKMKKTFWHAVCKDGVRIVFAG